MISITSDVVIARVQAAVAMHSVMGGGSRTLLTDDHRNALNVMAGNAFLMAVSRIRKYVSEFEINPNDYYQSTPADGVITMSVELDPDIKGVDQAHFRVLTERYIELEVLSSVTAASDATLSAAYAAEACAVMQSLAEAVELPAAGSAARIVPYRV